MSTVPVAAAGATAVIRVSELTVTEGEATPPKLTVLPDTKPLPAMATASPPWSGPAVGKTPLTEGPP